MVLLCCSLERSELGSQVKSATGGAEFVTVVSNLIKINVL